MLMHEDMHLSSLALKFLLEFKMVKFKLSPIKRFTIRQYYQYT